MLQPFDSKLNISGRQSNLETPEEQKLNTSQHTVQTEQARIEVVQEEAIRARKSKKDRKIVKKTEEVWSIFKKSI